MSHLEPPHPQPSRPEPRRRADADGFHTWPTGRLLSTAARLLEHSWEEVLRGQDMTHAGLIALHALADGPHSQRDIARACRVTDQTISRTVERLERSGFVTRATDPGDERRRRIELTARGRETYTRLLELERDDASLTAGVSDPAALRRLLVELIEARHTPPEQRVDRAGRHRVRTPARESSGNPPGTASPEPPAAHRSAPATPRSPDR